MAQFIKIISKGREYLVKLTSDEMEKGKKAQIGETSIFGDGKTYKKVSENRWEPISEPGSHTHKNSGGGHSMHDEKKSESQGDITPSKLHEKFRVYMENMPTERRALFRGGKMNFEKKMFVSNDGKLALHYKDGKITIAKHEGMEKAYNERPGHKYYKRIMKPTGKGFYYFYNKDEYEQFKDSKYKPEKKSIWSGIMAFFSLKDEKKAEEKVRSLHESNKEKLAGVSLKTFAQYLNEYVTNKEKWNKKFSEKKAEKGESKGGSGEKKSSGEKKESGEKKSPTWNVKLMKTVAEIVGGVKGGEKSNNFNDTKFEKELSRKGAGTGSSGADYKIIMTDDDKYAVERVFKGKRETILGIGSGRFESIDEAKKWAIKDNEGDINAGSPNLSKEKSGDKTEIMSGEKKKTREEKSKEVDEIISKWKKVFGNKFNDFELLTLNNIMLAEEKGKTQMIPASIKQVKENMPNLYKLFNKDHLRYAGALPATKEIESLINEYKSKSGNNESPEKPSESKTESPDNFETMRQYQSEMVLNIKKELKQANKEFEKIDKKDWKHNRELAIERAEIQDREYKLTEKLKDMDGSRGPDKIRNEYRKIVEKKDTLSVEDQREFPDLAADEIKKQTGLNFYHNEEINPGVRGITFYDNDLKEHYHVNNVYGEGQFSVEINGQTEYASRSMYGGTREKVFTPGTFVNFIKERKDEKVKQEKAVEPIYKKELKSKIYSDPNLKHKDGTYKTKISFDPIRPKLKKLQNADEYEKQVFENLKVSNILNAQNPIKPAFMYSIDAQNDGVWTDSRALIHDKKVTDEIYKINKQNLYLEAINPKKMPGAEKATEEDRLKYIADKQYNAGQFPNWKQIMPKEIPSKKAEFTGWYDPDPKHPAQKVEYSDGDTTVWANASFIATMKTLFPTATMHLTGKMSPIVFKVGNEVKALVMPIQRGDSRGDMVDIKKESKEQKEISDTVKRQNEMEQARDFEGKRQAILKATDEHKKAEVDKLSHDEAKKFIEAMNVAPGWDRLAIKYTIEKYPDLKPLYHQEKPENYKPVLETPKDNSKGNLAINHDYIKTLKPVESGKLSQSLNRKYNNNGKIQSMREMIESGDYVRKEKSEQNKYEYSRTKYNRMDAKQQAEYEKKLKEKKISYRLYGKDDSFIEVPKTVFDAIKDKNQTEKMQKAAQLLLSELQKAKKAGMGETRTHKDGSKWKKVGEGKWEPVPEGKGGEDGSKKKPDNGKKKPDDKKTDPKKKEGEGKRGIMRDALKKVADILANALSMKETVDPAGQAIEKTGENEMDKNKKGLKTPNVKKPERKKIPTTEGSWKKQKTDKPKKVPTNDI